ncbi:tyrosine-type recombinase/integrase [Pseudomonas resinovorans]|uniref:Tyrosine-type recombinase/integrase n=1 Tax=Metapseudomonas resinovorans TaxID=53412 RepID=A0ABT4YAS1_METRE|nr:tyrosine-type recombinase/integrase [Pseudomonas resinovorans]MDA8485732.1 tyrosine-type recombinase/integrase [Pseudomonas resinovorans]
MAVKVVAVRSQVLDLQESALNEAGFKVGEVVKVTGAGVFDDEERLLPLISWYISHGVRNATLSLDSAETYGKNLGYCHEYLNGRREFQGLVRDEAFLDVGTYVLEEYFAQLRNEDELSSKTIRNRDAALQSFFEKHLCRSIDDSPPLRTASSPYPYGLLSPSPKRSLVVACALEDLKQLILSTRSERERCLLQFIFDTGVRRSEVPRVTLAAIDAALSFQNAQFVSRGGNDAIQADYCPLLIHGSKGRGGESKERYTIVSRATLQRVKKYHASPLYKMYSRQFQSPETTPAFLNANGGAYKPNSISKLLERVSNRALAKLKIKKAISPHKLRHGNAYAILRSPDLGNDYLDRMVIVQKSLGHNHLSTSEMYTQIPQDIYQQLCRPDASTKTKAGEMEELVQQTRLKFSLGDTK